MLDYIKNKLRPGSFARNVLDLMTGAVLAQVIYAAVSPILTRLYLPQEIGALAMYNTIVVIVAVVLSWRYDLALVLPAETEDAANLLLLSIGIAVGMSAISVFIVAIGREQIAAMLGVPSLSEWFWALPVSFLAIGLYQPLNSWCLRKQQFKAISASKIGQAASTSAIQGIAGYPFHASIGGLLGGYIAGSLVATAILGIKTIINDARQIIKSFSWYRIRENARIYRKYPIFSTWPAFINTLSLSLPVLFITRFYDTETVGQYALSFRILQTPLVLIGVSIGRVYFQRLADEKNRTDDISATVEATFRKLLFLSLPGGLILLFFAPIIFKFVFGPQWELAGRFSQILAPAMMMRFVTSPLTTAFGVSNRQEVAAIWQIGQLLSTAAFLYGSLYFGGAIHTIWALAINDSLLYLIYLILIFKISKASFRRAFRI